ncbi:MAG: hypothetical protein ABMA01_20390 [Chthoniobacteraceae bacterium]
MPVDLYSAGLKVFDVQKLDWLPIQENLERWNDREFRPDDFSQFLLGDEVPCYDGTYFSSVGTCFTFVRDCKLEGTRAGSGRALDTTGEGLSLLCGSHFVSICEAECSMSSFTTSPEGHTFLTRYSVRVFSVSPL